MWSKYSWFSTPAFVFALLISVLTADVLARADVVTASKPYILTPKPSQKPRINGAKIFGVRPGRPFLFTIRLQASDRLSFRQKVCRKD